MRAEIVVHARAWVGTPFAHMQRKKGIGVDCAGLLIGVARELAIVSQNFDVPPYTRNPDGKSLIAWCEQYMKRITREQMQPGDAVVVAPDKRPQHLGILGDYRHGGLSIIHAAEIASPPRVIETRLMFGRGMEFVAVYSFPGVG